MAAHLTPDGVRESATHAAHSHSVHASECIPPNGSSTPLAEQLDLLPADAGRPSRGRPRRLALAGVIARVTGGALGALFLLTVSAPSALATTGGASMPWDQPLQRLLDNLAGPTARTLVILAIVGCGLLWAFTRNEEGLKKLGQVAFGGAIALGAVTMMASLGFAGAAV